jgi:hypothetical protein
MSSSERVEAMELLWESFSTEGIDSPSPDWHGKVLAERSEVFRDSIIADLRRLGVYFGKHRILLDRFRALSSKFPYVTENRWVGFPFREAEMRNVLNPALYKRENPCQTPSNLAATARRKPASHHAQRHLDP